MWMLTYSQYVPAAKVPALKQKPSQAASRGVAPYHRNMSTAGQMIANSHHWSGANAHASNAPATSAARHRTFIEVRIRCREAAQQAARDRAGELPSAHQYDAGRHGRRGTQNQRCWRTHRVSAAVRALSFF